MLGPRAGAFDDSDIPDDTDDDEDLKNDPISQMDMTVSDLLRILYCLVLAAVYKTCIKLNLIYVIFVGTFNFIFEGKCCTECQWLCGSSRAFECRGDARDSKRSESEVKLGLEGFRPFIGYDDKPLHMLRGGDL